VASKTALEIAAKENAMAGMITLLGKIRGRMGMYTGTTSIIKLAAFLRGYDLALVEEGKRDDLLEKFRNWIQNRFGADKKSWEALILEQSANEEDAVGRFYELFDEFLNELDHKLLQSQGLPRETQTSQANPVSGAV